MKKIVLVVPLSIVTFFGLRAQVGGSYVYAFLRQAPSARQTGLSSSQIAHRDDDVVNAQLNPALLNPSMHNALTFNQQFLLAGLRSGYAAYAYNVDAWKMTFHAGIQYVNYGTFKQADEFGNVQGEFKANDYAITLGAGRAINERLSAGLNLRFISSQLESYSSTGLAADLSGAYWHPEKQFGATILFRNIGAQLSTYTGIRGDMPLDVQIGASKKLAKAPFRFSLVAHSLNRWNLRYDNPLDQQTNLLGDATDEPSAIAQFADNLFRHFNFGSEIIFGKKENVRLRFGYSHQVRREMTVTNTRSTAGFSLGLGFKVNRFRIDYGMGRQQIAGNFNHLSISTNINEFKKSR